MLAVLLGQREQHQHDRDHVDAEQVVLAVLAAAGRQAVVHEPGAQQAERRAVGAERQEGLGVHEQRRRLREGDHRHAGGAATARTRAITAQRAEAALEQRAEDARRATSVTNA